MKTEISDFCKEYSRVLIPVGAALDSAIEQIQRDSQEDVLRLNLAGLNEVKHRLKSLIDKVEGQQAYLLIFGPLKSGKSTLMNAISSAYVSEVTSLPAYPCLVYVRHEDKPTIKLTRYNGRETTTEDKHIMKVIIDDSHSNLADRIRRIEEVGREFDPGLDYPEAIRRIDIGWKAPELNDSGTVLVDTPGLYSRMKFGYDLMTREFRNSAACAVFVVKTENLFLEQVFDEFNDLLTFFSRVFLVVNLDSSKRDLLPDGSLQPSDESQNPQKIVEAFQLLSMSAKLRSAWNEGRLKIYPVDLLKAASKRLKRGKGTSEAATKIVDSVFDSASSDANELPKSQSSQSSQSSQKIDSQSSQSSKSSQTIDSESCDDFHAFLSDLTEYLNSSDYLFELMNDSFRQGDLLREEVAKSCEAGAIEGFVFQQQRLRNDIEELDKQLSAAKDLAKFDWEEAFESTHADVEREVSRFAREVKGELRKSLQTGIDNWFETSDCLGDLIHKTWAGRMESLQKQIAKKAAAAVKDVLDSSSGGARPKPEIIIALDRVHLSLREVYKASISALGDLPKVAPCAIELDVNEIPVRRSFWDRLFFQSQSKVRRRLLGVAGELKNEISPHKKRKRLLPAGKQSLEKMVEDQLEALLPGIPNRCSRDYLKAYVVCFKREFSKQLEKRLDELGKDRQQIERQIEAGNRISKSFRFLDVAIAGLEGEIARLKDKFLRSARLARGFRFVDTRTGAFSIWSAAFVGGVSLLPPTLIQQTRFKPDAEDRRRAFTLWTSEFLDTPMMDSLADHKTCIADKTPIAEDVNALIDVSSPKSSSKASDGSALKIAENADEPSENESADSGEASEDEISPPPLRIIPKSQDKTGN